MSKEKEAELREQLDEAFEADEEERERIKQALRSKLVQSGWRDEIKVRACVSPPRGASLSHLFFLFALFLQARITELISARGVDNVTVEQIIEDVMPYAKDAVGDDVKNSLLQMIRDSLQTKTKI